MSFHSQFGEDQWIAENLKIPDAALFCEVGAFDGIQSSNTLFLEEGKYLWSGMLIEPNPKQWELCRRNRPKCVSICCAIGSAIGDRPFYINEQDEGVSSLIGPGRQITQWVADLSSLWNSFFLHRPYLLSIDTEGTELDVWNTAHWLRPEIVIVEHLSLPNGSRADEIVRMLNCNGYKEVHRTFANLIFVSENSDCISNPS